MKVDHRVLPYTDDGGTPEGMVAIGAVWEDQKAVKMILHKKDNPEETVGYLVLLDIATDDEPGNAAIKRMTGAKTVNLWHVLHQGGSTLVRDLDQVIVLEKLLASRHGFDTE